MNVRFQLERLEERRLFSAATLDIGLSDAEHLLSVRAATLNEPAGPTAVTDAGDPSHDTAPTASSMSGLTVGSGAGVGPTAPQGEIGPFQIFDATFGAGDVAPGMLPSYWTSPAPFSDGQGNYSPTRPRVEQVATVASQGGQSVDGRTVTPGMFTALDLELSEANSPKFMLRRLQWFRKVSKSAQITLIGYQVLNFGLYREQIISPSPETQAQIQANFQARAPIARRLNVVSLDAYMLGPQYVDRDLAYFRAMTTLLRSYFPDRRIYAWAWGAYATPQNPEGSVMPPDVMQKYVDTLRATCDGVVVWGQKSDNTLFSQMLMASV